MALLAVQVHSNGQRQIWQVVVRSLGVRVKEVYEGDPEPLVSVVLTMARKLYKCMPQPLFGAKDVCYTEKKTGTKTLFLGRRACI